MIIGLDMGHTLSGAGTGARGYVEETVKNREAGNRLMAMLREKGHTVINCTVDKSSNDLYDRVRKANAQKLDLFVSLHLNAFKSTTSEMGVETHIYNGNYSGKEANRRYAQAIQTALVQEVKWIDRKVKESNFYVLRETVAPAVLVELGFCDSQGDMNKWNTEKIAAALFRGITGTAYVAVAAPGVNTGKGETFKVGDRVVVSKNATTYATGQNIASWVFNKDLTLEGAPAFQPYIVIVDTDVLNVRTGAGVSYPIATTVKKGQAFTIVEVKDGWGKLKSGAGWISLEYTKKK